MPVLTLKLFLLAVIPLVHFGLEKMGAMDKIYCSYFVKQCLQKFIGSFSSLTS